MYAAFVKLLNMSAASSVLIAAVLLLRLLLRKIPKKYICLLWAICALRLCIPGSISSVLSVYNYIGAADPATGAVEYVHYSRSEKPTLRLPVYTLPASADNEAPEPRQADLYLPAVMTAWAVGCSAMLAYSAWSFAKLRAQTSAALRYRKNVYLCDHIPGPFILGILRPRIYLPSSLTGEQVTSVLAHERAHLARLDHWWKPLGYLLLCIHWFNPLVWLGYVLLSRDIEAACDEKVISGMNAKQKQDYSSTLLQCSLPQKRITVCPLAFGETGVKQRIRGILNYRRPTAWIIVFSLILCLASAAVFLTDPVQAAQTGLPATPAASVRYILTIGEAAQDVTYIAVEHPGGSGGCANADDSAFRTGEEVWLEPLDGLTELKNVKLQAFAKDDLLMWEYSIPEGIREPVVTMADGWVLRRQGELPEAEPETVVLNGPMILHSGDLTYTLPEGLQFTYTVSNTPENGKFLHDGDTVGGIRISSMDESLLLTGMDWIQKLELPEYEMNDVGYFVDGPLGGPYTLEIFSDVPAGAEKTVDNIHHLYYWQGMLYDLWFDSLKLDERIQDQILAQVSVSIPAGETAAEFTSQLPLSLYGAPDETARVIGVLQPNEPFLISNEREIDGSLWAYGTMAQQDIIGWLNMSGAGDVSDPVIYITEAEYPVYSAPSKSAADIGTLTSGEKYIVLRMERVGESQWFCISGREQELTGWIQLDGTLTAA